MKTITFTSYLRVQDLFEAPDDFFDHLGCEFDLLGMAVAHALELQKFRGRQVRPTVDSVHLTVQELPVFLDAADERINAFLDAPNFG